MKKIWQIAVRSLGRFGLTFVVGASALILTFAWHRSSVFDWISAMGVIAAITMGIFFDRRDKFRKQQVRDRALEIVRRLRGSHQGLGNASKEELEAILVALNGDSS